MERWGLVGLLLFASTAFACGGDRLTLSVDARSDLSPGMEFNSVVVEVFNATALDGPAQRTTLASAADDFVTGVRVAEFDGLASGSVVVHVELRSPDGPVVVERDVRISVEEDTGVVVVLTRECGGVTCPNASSAPAATECLGGVCVEPDCSSLNREACGGAAGGCTTDGDCTVCTAGQCVEGVCFCTTTPPPGTCGGLAMDCDGNPDNGCETVVDTIDHCGACDNACEVLRGTPACTDGACTVESCDTGWGDCNGDGNCTTNLTSSTTDCGRCGDECGLGERCCDGSCNVACI